MIYVNITKELQYVLIPTQLLQAKEKQWYIQ
jgi:hypothetical protein